MGKNTQHLPARLSLLPFGSVFTGCGDGVVRAYDAKSGTLRRHYTGHEGAVNCVVVARDKIFTGSSDSTLRYCCQT